MPSCAVPTCKNAVGLTKKQDGITFHVFPADEERKAVWTKIIQTARLEELWKPSKHSVICSMHFEDKYIYETKCGLKRLKKEAFPNKHLAIIVEESVSCTEKSKNAKQLHSPATSNSVIGNVNISDLDYLFESPKIVKLRSQLRHKQIISKKHVRRIKTLQQKNRRLLKENEYLKGILRNLKNNRYVNDYDPSPASPTSVPKLPDSSGSGRGTCRGCIPRDGPTSPVSSRDPLGGDSPPSGSREESGAAGGLGNAGGMTLSPST